MTPPAAERLYDAMLHLYPPAFYRQYAGDMLIDFRDSYRSLRARESWHVAVYVAHAFVDLTASVAEQWGRTDCLRVAMCAAVGTIAFWAIAIGIAWREWPHSPITVTSLMQLVVFGTVTTMVIVTAITVGSERRVPPLSLRRFTDPVIDSSNS